MTDHATALCPLLSMRSLISQQAQLRIDVIPGHGCQPCSMELQGVVTEIGLNVSFKSELLRPACMQVYGVIGIFGAARYGAKTEGNVLVNEWLGGPAEGFLDLAIAAYLSISVPPMQVPRAHLCLEMFDSISVSKYTCVPCFL